jgi:hypothetical protein
MSSTKPDLEIVYFEEEHTKELARVETETGLGPLKARQRFLDEHGFAGDGEVPVLGLEEMEDELTMEAAERQHRLAPFVNVDRHAYRNGIPFADAPPDVQREVKANDLDDMTRMEWDDEG